jgi:hypothetical protein
MAWTTYVHPEAQAELDDLPRREYNAMINVIDKLQELGPKLVPPHTKRILGQADLHELRPRAGHSPWRAFYRLVGDVYVIAAIGPDAQHKPRRFIRTVIAAEERLKDLEED